MSDIAWQVDRYLEWGMAGLAGVTEAEFRVLAAPAVAAAARLDASVPPGTDAGGSHHYPGVLVVTRTLVDPEARVPLLRLPRSAKPGILDKNHFSDAVTGLEPYQPRAALGVPDAPMYVLLDVERGDEYRDVAPLDARPRIAARGRTPLTIDEGLSLLALHPAALAKNHCFMLDGSSRGDKRVPALWISAGAPKLGWCFDKVPHSWLGVASAGARLAG